MEAHIHQPLMSAHDQVGPMQAVDIHEDHMPVNIPQHLMWASILLDPMSVGILLDRMKASVLLDPLPVSILLDRMKASILPDPM
jgi:hypothetical protein